MSTFDLGRIVITRGAAAAFDSTVAQFCLRKHAEGDWGSLSPEDWAENERALKEGGRLLSSYGSEGEKLWVITEEDRSVTTILLPSEY